MSEFNNIVNEEFFIIDSNNLDYVTTKLYGFFIGEGQIIRNSDFKSDIVLSPFGSYVYVKKTGDMISIYQDFDGCYGIYLFKNKDGEFCISNSFMYLLEYINFKYDLSLNENYAKSYLTSTLCSFAYKQTLVNEIETLPRNYCVHINLKTKEIGYEVIDYGENTVPLNSKEGIEILDDWFYRWTSLFHNIKQQTNNIQVDLSGGFDTRVVLSLLLSSDIDLGEITVNSINDKKYVHEQDYKIASKIANEFNFKLNNRENLNLCRYYFKEIETPINISFYTKLGFHNQMYYQNHKNIVPFYSITGYGGEIIRGYDGESYSSFLNHASEVSKDFVNPTKNILDYNISQFIESYGISEVRKNFNLIQYKEVRRNYHYSRANVEKYLGNIINLTPLTDVYLNKLITLNEHCDDPKLLIAIIFLRYCPKLLNFEFEGGRSIDEKTIEYAKEINYRFPFVKKELKNKQINTYVVEDLNENEGGFTFDDLNSYLKKIFFSENYKKTFENYFSSEIYENIKYKVKTMNYFPLQYAYPTFAILRTISLVNKNDNALFEWINHFIEVPTNKFGNSQWKLKLLNYMRARVDIINFGGEINNVELIRTSDLENKVIDPLWLKPTKGYGTVVESCNGSIDLLVKCIGDGDLKISLRGMDARDKYGKRFPIYVDFTKLFVDGQNILNESKLIWHDTPFSYMKKVKDGDFIQIHIEWKPFDENSCFK